MSENAPSAKVRSSDLVEERLIRRILSGQYLPDTCLPAERDLAASLGVGRPTLREATQRLERDGWVTIRKRQPAIVNDYWRKGNLMTLVNIIQNSDEAPSALVLHLMELRTRLIPPLARDAVFANRPKVVSLLANLGDLSDDEHAFAEFDWHLQKGLATLAPNPIYLLILNSFDQFYLRFAKEYFSSANHRIASFRFYRSLLDQALAGDENRAERVTKEAMEESVALWKESNCAKGGTIG